MEKEIKQMKLPIEGSCLIEAGCHNQGLNSPNSSFLKNNLPQRSLLNKQEVNPKASGRLSERDAVSESMLAWSQRMLNENSQQQRHQRGFRIILQQQAPNQGLIMGAPAQQQPRGKFKLPPQFQVHAVEQEKYTKIASPKISSADNPLRSLISQESDFTDKTNSNKLKGQIKADNDVTLTRIAALNELTVLPQTTKNNQRASPSLLLDDSNQFVPKFSAKAMMKNSTSHCSVVLKPANMDSGTIRDKSKQTTSQVSDRFSSEVQNTGSPMADLPHQSPCQPFQIQITATSSINCDTHLDLALVSSVTKRRSSIERPQVIVTSPQGERLYTSQSKQRLLQQNQSATPSRQHYERKNSSSSRLKHLVNNGPADQSSSLPRSSTRAGLIKEAPLDDENEDFHRFNENLEEMVVYREKDPRAGFGGGIVGRSHGRRITHNVTQQASGSTFREIQRFIEQAAPNGINPVQKSLLLLSKHSLNIEIPQEQLKIMGNLSFRQSLRSPSNLKLESPILKNLKQQQFGEQASSFDNTQHRKSLLSLNRSLVGGGQAPITPGSPSQDKFDREFNSARSSLYKIPALRDSYMFSMFNNPSIRNSYRDQKITPLKPKNILPLRLSIKTSGNLEASNQGRIIAHQKNNSRLLLGRSNRLNLDLHPLSNQGMGKSSNSKYQEVVEPRGANIYLGRKSNIAQKKASNKTQLQHKAFDNALQQKNPRNSLNYPLQSYQRNNPALRTISSPLRPASLPQKAQPPIQKARVSSISSRPLSPKEQFLQKTDALTKKLMKTERDMGGRASAFNSCQTSRIAKGLQIRQRYEVKNNEK